MRTSTMILVAGVVAACTPAWALADDVLVVGPIRVVVTSNGDSNNPVVRVFDAAGNAVANPKAAKVENVDAAAGPAVPAAVAQPRIDPNRPYMGIHVCPVPAAVASQLRLDDKGVMIRNVAKGSPADKAGLDRYDVVVGIANEENAPVLNVDQLIKAIYACKPGETLTLEVIRGGKRQSARVKLGSWPAQPIEYIYADDPDDQVSDDLNLRRGVIRKQGDKWVFQGAGGDAVKPGDLPEWVRKELAKAGAPISRVQVRVTTDANGKRRMTVSSVSNGKTLAVQSGADGKIQVKRTGPDGKSESATYENGDQLKAKDADAYGLYKRVHANLGKGPAASAKMREQMLARLADRARASAASKAKTGAERVEKAGRRFDVDEQGRVKVQIVKDGNELTMAFASVDEMKNKQPDLYKEYEKLLAGTKDGK